MPLRLVFAPVLHNLRGRNVRLAPLLVSIVLLLTPCFGQEGPAAPLSTGMRSPTAAGRPGENGESFAQPANALTTSAKAVHLTMGREPSRQQPGGGGSPPIPEPSTLLLVGGGLVGIALTNRWRRRRSAS